MDTTATIPTGSMAERWKFKSFMVYGIFVGAIIYPLYANWVWGGGWLSKLGSNFGLGHGHVDFRGLLGGAPDRRGAGAGRRQAARSAHGQVQPRTARPIAIPGHHIPMAIVGCFILAFGWFGFNAGSTLAGTDLRIGVVAVNTMLAGAAGAFSSMLYMWLRYGKPDISMTANGLLAGLVAITAPCAFVTAPAAVLIGLIAGTAPLLGRGLRGAHAQDRRPGRRDLGARGQRCLGRLLRGALRRRQLRRRTQRREGHGHRPLLRRCRPTGGPVRRHPDQHRLRRGDRVRRLQTPG